MAEHRASLLDRPVFGKIGPQAPLFDRPLPREGLPADDVLAFVREHVLPFAFGNSHPRFFAFINATADPLGTVADYLAAAMNPNCWGGDHAAVHVETQVMRWLAEILGLPPTAEGILASGGSMANFTALAAARRAMAKGDVREDGMAGVAAHGRLRLRPGPQLRGQVGGPARHRPEAAPQDPNRRPLPHAGRPASGSSRRRPPRRPAPRHRGRQRGHREHGQHRSPGRARRLLPPGRPLVPRRRRLRRPGRDLAAAAAALRRHGASGLGGRRPAQVDVRALRGGRGAGAGARSARRHLPQARRVPRSRRGEPRHRPHLVQRSRPRAVARFPGPQGLHGPAAPRHERVRDGHRARRRPRPLPRRRGEATAATSSCWRSPRFRS